MASYYHPQSPQAYACSVVDNTNCKLPAIADMISMGWWNTYDLAQAFRIIQGRTVQVTARPYYLSYFHWVANIRQKWCHVARADPFVGLESAPFAVVQILLLDICRDYLDLTWGSNGWRISYESVLNGQVLDIVNPDHLQYSNQDGQGPYADMNQSGPHFNTNGQGSRADRNAFVPHTEYNAADQVRTGDTRSWLWRDNSGRGQGSRKRRSDRNRGGRGGHQGQGS